MFNEIQQASWPGWQTISLIGRGSFGEVYKIQRSVFGDVEEAALKVISIPQNESDIEELYSDGYDDESVTKTFENHLQSIVAEYSLMKKLSSCVNIVYCDDVRYVQHDDGIGWDIFIKMELLTPLTKALPEEISDKDVIKIARDICTALEECKKHGIVHRDIKPQNIFVSANGTYKLGDFGIAKAVEKTMSGTKIGTYRYMAPEVYNNKPYGSSADIYSLGLVMYWLLNERRMPFLPLPPEKIGVGKDEEARHRRLSGEPLPSPKHGSEKLKQIVLKACAYDPKDRFLSAAEMFEALNNVNTSIEIPVISIDVADSGDRGDKAADNHPVEPPIYIPTPEPEPPKVKDDSDAAGGKDGGKKKIVAIIVALAIVIIAVIAGFTISNNRDNVDIASPTDEVSVFDEVDETEETTTEETTTKPTTTKQTTTKQTTTKQTTTKQTTTKPTTTEPTTTEPTTTEPTTTEPTTTEPTTTQIRYSDWVVGEWQDSQKSTNDLCQLLETRTLYPYFYYYCKKCGDGTRWYKPGDGCGKCGTVMDSAYCKIVWLTNPWSEAAHYRPFGQDTGYYAIHINTLAYWKWTGGSPKTQYKYKTRTILN